MNIIYLVVLTRQLDAKLGKNFVVQKVPDPKEKEENVMYFPAILNGLRTDGNNVLIPVDPKGLESDKPTVFQGMY